MPFRHQLIEWPGYALRFSLLPELLAKCQGVQLNTVTNVYKLVSLKKNNMFKSYQQWYVVDIFRDYSNTFLIHADQSMCAAIAKPSQDLGGQ
jgi:hypothetical protein